MEQVTLCKWNVQKLCANCALPFECASSAAEIASVDAPDCSCRSVAAGIVWWVHGEQYGIETLVMDHESREDMEQYLWQRVQAKRK